MSGTPLTQNKRPTARNPETLARFRRETWWQITFPMLVLTLLLLGGVVALVFWQGAGGASVVADFSLALLILPLLVLGLLALGLIVGLIYLVMVAIEKLPRYTYVAHQKTFMARDFVVGAANKITGVIISVRAIFDGILRFLTQRGLVPEAPDDKSSGVNHGRT